MKYRAKHEKQTKKNHFNKSAALLIALVLIVTVGVGSTVAFLIDGPVAVTNTFQPSKVTCEVVEDSFNGKEKTDVSIKNTSDTGDVDAYIRAAVVVTWKDDTTNRNVYGKQPVEGTDYTIQYNLTNGWVKGTDGYYYWTSPVKSEREAVNDCTTGVLITSCAPVADKAPSGYHLSVEIVAEAIQAEPTTAVTSSWASGVSGIDDDGTTLLIRSFTQQ